MNLIRPGSDSSIGRATCRPRRIGKMGAVEEADMKRADSKKIPLHDYGLALRSAVSWLGDRYLLAEPVRRRSEDVGGYYVEPRRWRQVVRQHATT
jgi:hypothetical protein